MRIGKPQSKRTPVRLRHKIQKASAAKQRKNRKDAKKNPQWRSRLKKDPGIPNLFPFKAKMLAEIEETKRRKEEEQQQRREIAKAQRQGATVRAKAQPSTPEMEDELLDDEDESDEENEMDFQDDANPMAALLASAQARAQTFTEDGDEQDSDEDLSEGEEGEDEWDGIQSREPRQKTAQAPRAKTLPKQALKDPIQSVTILLERMQNTQDGIQMMLDHYQIPALVTSGADFPSRFLVEVARKTGRLGKGGVPNLHSAGLTVLSDLNEERLVLPANAPAQVQKQPKGVSKGSVQVVSQMSQPFRLEGLWEVHGTEMVVET